jgi:hypothetical protein
MVQLTLWPDLAPDWIEALLADPAINPKETK